MIPFHIETLYRHRPVANWALLGATLLGGVAVCSGLLLPAEITANIALGGGSHAALFAHLIAPDRIAALGVDLLFLWVAGNAICGLVGQLPFLLLYLALGTVTGVAQLAIGGSPVLGAGGAVAGMIGLCIAFLPTNAVLLYYPALSGLAARPAPVWTLLVYWGAWSALACLLHLDPTAPWGHLLGLCTGIGLGVAMVLAGWVEFTECDNGPLIVRHRAPRPGDPAEQEDSLPEDEARAELRRLARQYIDEYATLPEIKVGMAIVDQRRLTLRRSMEFARTAAAPSSQSPVVPRLIPRTAAAPQPLPVRPRPINTALRRAPGLQATAWPNDLPDVRFFHFDGTKRHGPESRSDFLCCLSLCADTSRWWYWADGMQSWAKVEELARRIPDANRQRALGDAPLNA